MSPDLINASFEAMASAAVLNHCRALLRDRTVNGVSTASTGFFFAWGLWNLFYYPHIGQPLSFAAGIAVTASNCLWLVLLVVFSKRPA